jgi:hypothetical protein
MESAMKHRIKLWLRRWVIRQLIKLVDRAEERLQAWQVRLRENLASHAVPVKQSLPVENERAEANTRDGRVGSVGRRRISFLEWEARKSGVAVITKKEARRREHLTAAGFDRRFAT